MATEGPGPAGVPSLTSLPRFEDIPRTGEGLDPDRVQDAFDGFRRHAAQLQAQLRVLQAAGSRAGTAVETSGHAVRMDALHLIRGAAEFADTIERDAQNASAAQLARTEEEVSRRQHELQAQEAEVDRYRQESERQRAEIMNAARSEARELLSRANTDATRELQEAEAKGARLLEQSRHQATELTNTARAEVEQTLEWARTQAAAVLARAQHGAEQLLAAAGLGQEAIAHVAEAIVRAAELASEGSRPVPSTPQPPAAVFAATDEAAQELLPEPPFSDVGEASAEAPPPSTLPPPFTPPPDEGAQPDNAEQPEGGPGQEPSEPYL